MGVLVNRELDYSLVRLAEQSVAAGDGEWSVRVGPAWCVVAPAGCQPRRQGWKLHVSATQLSAPDVLDRALSVVLPARCVFKFAASPARVAWLNSRACPRGGFGKFMTVYPNDDTQFRALAEALHGACTGLAGPEILSDRRYRPGSPVHYRFGAFDGSTLVDDDGCLRPAITGPDGTMVEDRREAWFTPPDWADPVLVDPPAPATAPRPVLVGDRFLVVEAIAHSARGGVFRGHDVRTGATVVLKQARAHVETDATGRDCRDRLRDEAALLARLAAGGLTARPVAVVDRGEHVFLVQELIDGTALRTWVNQRLRDGGLPVQEGLAMARAVARLVRAVHRCGLVLVDVSPENIMVRPDRSLRLIDLEHAVPAGRRTHPATTPGYTAPEHSGGAAVAVRAAARADLYGLGGLLFLLATGSDPVLAEESPPGRGTHERVGEILAAAGADLPLARRLAPAIVGAMHDEPGQRWSTARILAFLNGSPPAVTPSPARSGCEHDDLDDLVRDGLAYLAAAMTPQAERLWPTSTFGQSTDPCAVQHGAAGVLATLRLGAAHAPDPGLVRAALPQACRWVGERSDATRRILPGLNFGSSGTAWALHDAALLLGDERAADRALHLGAAVPVVWPNPDVAHGAAGAGMLQLHLWQATGQDRFARRATLCAEALAAAAGRTGGAVSWPVPAGMNSSLAGRTFHGFAHGTAGVGEFLLAAGQVLGTGAHLDLARLAGDTLVTAVTERDGAALWETEPGRGNAGEAGWCKGSAGIGGFLLRLWQATGEPSYLRVARQAARAVSRERWWSNSSACHGLAGGGQFLLDLAYALGEQSYRHQAGQLARVILARRVRRDGLWVLADDGGLAVTADYGSGMAGVLAFLLRLRHGAARLWTVPAPLTSTPEPEAWPGHDDDGKGNHRGSRRDRLHA